MTSIAVFNNKGGVGKTTLTFHLAHALAALGKKTLVVDLDPQCNISIYCLSETQIGSIWSKEDAFVEDFQAARQARGDKSFKILVDEVRSVHFMLKPAEDGLSDLEVFPRPHEISEKLAIIPGRLSLHMYEDKLSSRWSDLFVGDPLAIYTVTNIRRLAARYVETYGYEFVIFDTSPSLGILNRVILSLTDFFIIPCNPDLFSLYGIRNIGRSLDEWQRNFTVLRQVLPVNKLSNFPEKPVQFLGYTIFNAKKYTGQNKWNLASGHLNYAKQIPDNVDKFISQNLRAPIDQSTLKEPIGDTAVMHTHSTMAAMAQKYRVPIWKVPSVVTGDDTSSVAGNRRVYEATRIKYTSFAKDLLQRVEAAQ